MQQSGAQEQEMVLVVDDDPLALELFGLILRAGGFQVITTDSAAGVIQIISERRPDALVVDLHMPTMHGDRLIRMLLGRPETSGLPIVLTSGDGPEVLRRAARGLPSVQILTKEAARHGLVPLLRKLLRQADSTAPFALPR